MSDVSAGGIVLRELAGGEGKVCSLAVDVTLRTRDFGLVTMRDPATGREQQGPADGLVAFTADRFRELTVTRDSVREGADVWEFRVQAPPTSALLYVSGADILTVRVMSQVL
jgi:hypothetical protein